MAGIRMASKSRTHIAVVCGLAAASIAAGALAIRSRPATLAVGPLPAASFDRMSNFPRLVLWAWERPEDLRFIDPREIGVAFLTETVYLRGEGIVVRPRMQPLALAPDTKRIAVVRIETDLRSGPNLSDGQRMRLVEELARVAGIDGAAALQIDFDARVSERAFYRALLNDLRARLPAAARLSITALGSWCFGDNWITDLPIDEAVPMLFRMGADESNIMSRIKAGGEFSAPVARLSVGVSTDEQPGGRVGAHFAGRRIYVFNTRSWSAASVAQITQEVQQWQ